MSVKLPLNSNSHYKLACFNHLAAQTTTVRRLFYFCDRNSELSILNLTRMLSSLVALLAHVTSPQGKSYGLVGAPAVVSITIQTL